MPSAPGTVGVPQLLWEGQYQTRGFTPVYDVTPDGQRFLMVRNDEAAPVRRLEVILNWADAVETVIAEH